MGAGLVSLLITVGASAWIYSKLQRYSGSNTKQSAIATAVAAVLIFVVCFFVLSIIFN